MRHRKSSFHLRAEPPCLSLITSLGWWVQPALPFALSVPCKRPPGDLSGSEAAGVDARKAGHLHVHPSSCGSMPIRKKSPERRKWLKMLINRLQEKPASASLCVAVSKHPSLGKLTFLLTASLTVLWKSNYPIKLTLAKLHRTGIKTISDCRIEAWVMCLAHWTCGLSALRAGNILGKRLLFIFWRWTHSRRRSPKDAFFSTRGSKGMRFLLSALSLCDVAVHLSGWRLWAEVTSGQERALLCRVPCPCGAGWGGSPSSLSQLSPLRALGPRGCETLTKRPLDLSRKSIGPGVKRTGFQ